MLGFWVTTREAVDDLYSDLTGAGHKGHQPPYDAFRGGRYAIVEDPDGNSIGLMSPTDPKLEFWPPSPPPRATCSSRAQASRRGPSVRRDHPLAVRQLPADPRVGQDRP